MRKILLIGEVLFLFLMIPSCKKQEFKEPIKTETEVVETVKVCPENASGIMKINDIDTPPESIFNTPASENGKEGTVYKFCGEVVSYESIKEKEASFDAVVVQTDLGEIYIADFYSMMIKESPDFEVEEIKKRFALPQTGENVCVYAEYSGYSSALDAPVAYLGNIDTIVRITAKAIEQKEAEIFASKDYEGRVDFFSDEKRCEKYNSLYYSCQYRILRDVVQQYIDENDVEDIDSAFSILEIINPMIPDDSKWIVGFDSVDGSFLVTFPGAEDISENCCVSPMLKGTNLSAKIGFIREDWIFFDIYRFGADGLSVFDGTLNYFDVTRDVIESGRISEYAYINLENEDIAPLYSADTPSIRFVNERTRDQFSHVLTENETDALRYGLLLKNANLQLEDLLYQYKKMHK